MSPNTQNKEASEQTATVSTEKIYEIFPAIAKKYELFNAVSSMGFYKSWLKKIIRLCPLTAQSEMLDVAGGTGEVSFTACRLKPPAHIQLTDLVPEMLEVAKLHVEQGKACGVPIDFDVVDAQNIPYADNSYDVVTMAYGIRNMPDRARALSEIYRVLKPGGTMVCLEFSTPTTGILRALYQFYLTHMIPFWGGLITGDREGFVYLRDSIQEFPDQKGYAKMLEAAGFTQVSWENCSGGITAIHTGVK